MKKKNKKIETGKYILEGEGIETPLVFTDVHLLEKYCKEKLKGKKVDVTGICKISVKYNSSLETPSFEIKWSPSIDTIK